MTKKRDALNKAKESGKEIVKGGKKVGLGVVEVIGGTTGALGYTLLSVGEKGIEKISNSKGNQEGITKKERKKYEASAKEYSQKSKKHIDNAKKGGKIAVSGVGKTLNGGVKIIGHAIKGGYHLVDAGDKAIGEQIVKNQIEKGKKPGKLGKYFRDNIMKLMLALSLTGTGGYKATKMVKDKPQAKQELVVKNEGNEMGAEIIESPEEGTLTFEEKPYFQNPDFFDKDFKVTRDETYKDKGIILMRDAGMTFYVVQDGETSKEQIKKKLSTIPEFSYLTDPEYDNKIMGFNVPDASLKKGLYIPIPLKSTDRQIGINEFREYSKIALKEMENDPHYGEKVKKLIKECGEERIIDIMTAFARCETATDQEKFRDPIGTAELHRREPRYKSFSFSYYHILMEKSADGKTPGPGLKARQNLGLTEGQCYHPKNAGKLFLGYCLEKKSDPTYFFRIKNLAEARTKGGKYNGSQSYGEKLWANIQHIKQYNLRAQQNKHYNSETQHIKSQKLNT